MEFWGVEVKPGQTLKVKPEDYKLIHISQAALGEVKVALEGPKYIPIRMKVDDKDFVIGYLSAEIKSQLQFDLVLEKEFELSHDWKYGSVYFVGFTANDPYVDISDSKDSDMSESSEFDSSSSDEDEVMAAPESGHAEPEPLTADAAKNDTENDDTDRIDAENDDSESSSDDVDDSDDDEDDESSEEEQELPQKGKKVKA